MVIPSGSTKFLTNPADALGGDGDHADLLLAPAAATSEPGVVGTDLPMLWRPTAAGLVRVAEILVTRRELWLHVARTLVEGLDERVQDDLDGSLGRSTSAAAPTRIAAFSGWEAWLHVWPAGSSTGWHRHAGPTASAVVSGRLRELHETDVPRTTGAAGASGWAGAARHTLVNDTPEAAVTLQVYGPREPFSARAEALLCRPGRPGRSLRHGIEHDAREAS